MQLIMTLWILKNLHPGRSRLRFLWLHARTPSINSNTYSIPSIQIKTIYIPVIHIIFNGAIHRLIAISLVCFNIYISCRCFVVLSCPRCLLRSSSSTSLCLIADIVYSLYMHAWASCCKLLLMDPIHPVAIPLIRCRLMRRIVDWSNPSNHSLDMFPVSLSPFLSYTSFPQNVLHVLIAQCAFEWSACCLSCVWCVWFCVCDYVYNDVDLCSFFLFRPSLSLCGILSLLSAVCECDGVEPVTEVTRAVAVVQIVSESNAATWVRICTCVGCGCVGVGVSIRVCTWVCMCMSMGIGISMSMGMDVYMFSVSVCVHSWRRWRWYEWNSDPIVECTCRRRPWWWYDSDIMR